jgi:molybdate transport system substrate-binding protein
MTRTGAYAARLSLAIAVAMIGAMLAACGSSSSTPTPAPAATAAAVSPTVSLSGTITVLAAASLTDAFNEEAAAFQKAHPGVTVKLNFGGSPTLVTQLDQGAPADVLATADDKNMKNATDKNLVVAPASTFVRNRLVIAIPKSNPGGIATPADLAKPGLKLVLAQKGVPAGDYARQIFANMAADPSYGAGFDTKVLKNLVSEEANVKAVVSKVQLGEADAAIVYRTDITAAVANDITAIDIPDPFNIVASYPIGVATKATQPAIAAAFVAFILSPDGQKILTDNGFIGASAPIASARGPMGLGRRMRFGADVGSVWLPGQDSNLQPIG